MCELDPNRVEFDLKREIIKYFKYLIVTNIIQVGLNAVFVSLFVLV